MKKILIALAMLAGVAFAADAQQIFKPTKASIVDESGPHEFFSSFNSAPIEVTDLGSVINILMGTEPLELSQEPDNMYEYSNTVRGKKHRDVITKAYRSPETGKIERITVTTTNPRPDMKALVITFTPSAPGL